MYRRDKSKWIKHIDFMILDIICMMGAFFIAYYTRHGSFRLIKNDVYLEAIMMLIFINLASVLVFDTYKNVLKRGYLKEAVISFKHVIFIEAIACIYIFAVKNGGDLSRQTVLLFPVFYYVIAYIIRIIWKQVVFRLPNNRSEKKFFVISSVDRASHAIEAAKKKHFGNYCILGLAIIDQDLVGQKICDENVVAYRDDILEYLKNKWVDEVIISVPSNSMLPAELLTGLIDMGIVTHVELVSIEDMTGSKSFIENIAGGTYITSSINTISSVDAFIKRTFDIVIGLVGSIVTIILMVILAPMIKKESPGPLFFKQKRVGRNGRHFEIYKFRSMYMDAEERKAELLKNNDINSDVMFKMENDPRIIGSRILPDGSYKKGIGNRIRDWSIDEFPQFFNVLRGDMSFIGTRPPTIDEWEKYNLYHRSRLAIKPGLTGMWQVSGRSNIKDFDQVVELDRKYIMEWSLGLDVKIFFKTIKVVLNKEGAR